MPGNNFRSIGIFNHISKTQIYFKICMSRYAVLLPVLLLFIALPQYLNAQSNQESYQKEFQSGIELFERGLFAEAAIFFEKAKHLSYDQKSSETSGFYHVRTLTRLDSAGIDLYVDRFVQEFPKSNRVAVLLREVANQHYVRGELSFAINRMDEALNYPQSGSDKTRLLYTLGEISAEDGQLDLARDYFLNLSDNHRRSDWSPKALYARGRLYLQEEKFNESAEAFELLRERHPFDAMTRRIGTALGESYYQQGRFEDAIRAFDDAMPHLDHENRQKAVYLMAESYNALQQYEDATRFYRQFINRATGDDDARIAHYGLGWVYHKQDIFHWAARAFGEAAVGNDNIARKALYYKGANEKLASRYDQAIESFREFGERFRDGVFSEQAYFEWAVTAFEVGFYGEAIEALRPLAQRADQLENPGQVLTF